MAISSAGLGSGIPINDLVSQLVAAEAAPVQNRLDRREAIIQTELSAIGVLKGALSDFQSKLAALADADSYTNRKTYVSDSDIASLTAEQTAALSSYSLEVDWLATAQKLVAQNGYSDASQGTLTFQNEAGDSFEVAIGTDDATLEGIAAAINDASDNFGVVAKIINDTNGDGRIVLSADETGVSNRITSIVATGTGDIQNFAYDYATAIDGDDANWDQTEAAVDARFYLEGQLMTSASNTIENAIPDVSFTLKGATEPASPITLRVEGSSAAVRSKIEAFVTAYNELNSLISQQTAYNAATEQAGVLQGDALTRSVQNQLRSLMTGQGSAFGSISALANLGITTQRDGSMVIDSAKLAAGLDTSFADVAGFFSDEDTGMAIKLDNMLDSYLNSSGTFSARTTSLTESLGRIDDQRESLAMRLEKLEARYLSQFNAMDALVATLSSTGNFLTQQLDSIAKIQQARFKS